MWHYVSHCRLRDGAYGLFRLMFQWGRGHVTAECPPAQLQAGEGAQKGFASSPGSTDASRRYTLRSRVVSHLLSMD